VKNLKPTRIIDFATLTGAIVIALGDAIAGLFSNDDVLANELIAAGRSSCDLVWRMPLMDAYKEKLKSEWADLNNVAADSAGSAITAALFLEAFIGDHTPWAHVDIAGVRYRKEAKGYLPKGATGFGVRLAVDFLRRLAYIDTNPCK
jgi:leucyl aminopeptidase